MFDDECDHRHAQTGDNHSDGSPRTQQGGHIETLIPDEPRLLCRCHFEGPG